MQLSDEEKRELAEVYERAAEYLEEHGWFGWDRREADWQAACMIIAIDKGQTISGKDRMMGVDPFEFAAKALELPTHGCGSLIHWNDEPTRTADEVINTLHALANKLR